MKKAFWFRWLGLTALVVGLSSPDEAHGQVVKEKPKVMAQLGAQAVPMAPAPKVGDKVAQPGGVKAVQPGGNQAVAPAANVEGKAAKPGGGASRPGRRHPSGS